MRVSVNTAAIISAVKYKWKQACWKYWWPAGRTAR